ncbi:Methyltransferase domain-containing protein [Nocardioides scoriae]|uniref:Methyltransferase domain-containing protein n=1 Tax=Nocardioides scoriae TaxID=642780 RepID=A0A1H1W318_9ACTN|nr:class I SAM-dependent methyltransferase [Nocardioides scoriae]SDS91352.1 Methyltransferase domain-containing protein [Nocardioides scoriae]
MADDPMYDAFAQDFETHATDSAWNAHYDRPAVLELVGDVAGSRVLDVGCGPGLYAAELVARGAEVVGCDASPRMVELARSRVGAAADLRVWDVERPLTWLADDAVDVAVMALVLHHVTARVPLLRELRRVVRTGGRLVLSTPHPTSDWLHLGGGYFERGWVEETWADGWPVRYWRQPLQDWLAEVAEAGWRLDRLVEPRPAPSMSAAHPDVASELGRRPGFVALGLV